MLLLPDNVERRWVLLQISARLEPSHGARGIIAQKAPQCHSDTRIYCIKLAGNFLDHIRHPWKIPFLTSHTLFLSNSAHWWSCTEHTLAFAVDLDLGNLLTSLTPLEACLPAFLSCSSPGRVPVLVPSVWWPTPGCRVPTPSPHARQQPHHSF